MTPTTKKWRYYIHYLFLVILITGCGATTVRDQYGNYSLARVQDVNEPIVEGSPFLLKQKVEKGKYYLLSDGRKLSFDQVDLIRSFMTSSDYPVGAAELLTYNNVSFDSIENRYVISSKVSSPIQIILTIDNKISSYLRFKYVGDSWIFADHFVLAIDDFRYRSTKKDFKRDNNTFVYEWVTYEMKDDFLKISNRIYSSKTPPTIRFFGDNKYHDQTFDELDISRSIHGETGFTLFKKSYELAILLTK